MGYNKKSASGILELEIVEEYGTMHGALSLFNPEVSLTSLHQVFGDFVGEHVRISIELVPEANET